MSFTSVNFVQNYVMVAKLWTVECEHLPRTGSFGGYK